MSKSFCHLHNHTEYSLLDGANRISDMVKRAKELEMPAIAISDHGVMFGVMDFYMEAQKQKIKPILGVEAYVAPSGIGKREGRAGKEAFHMLLLAKNLDGYRNLCKLSTIAALEGYYYKPRVDHELLRAHSSGLIATTACLGSEVCQALLDDDYDRAQYIAGMYSEMFGEDSYYVELQDHGLPEQHKVNEGLLRIARELKLPLLATNDAHYLCKADAQPHDVLLCIQTGELVANEKRMKFATDEFYLKTQDEMARLFPDHPEALENSLKIAEMCDVDLGKQRAPMPQPDVPEGMDNFDFLRSLAEKGLRDRLKDPERALDRLEYELSVIQKTGFGDYFLLVKEFAQATRDRGIYFGVRGSAAGSLVSYCIGITDVDPVEYGLTFERFLNPERISMPDVDMDFEDARRDEIIQYVTDRFGKDRVAQIITFGTLGAKAAIKDCGRVMGYLPQDTDRLTKLIPTLPGWSLDRAYKEITEFREAVDGDARNRELFETAKSVEGMSRNSGVHAAGVVISKEPLVDYIPLYRGNDGQAVTAFEMGILEKIGMLKMDFLGLSNLTVLARAVENIERAKGVRIDPRAIEDGDTKTYEMLGRGETIGVFQLEGGGMTRWVQQLKPANVRELAAMVALYRPGPMEHIPRFIDTKFKRIEAAYLDERMRPILEETFGIIVYQDQVMQLVQALAGFTLGKADVLRRAMGKKDAKAMDSMKVEFMDGCDSNGVSRDAAEKVWELLLPFAGYAFNKAHAVCYSILAYQTAYLKANYPTEYMAALLSVYLDKEDKVTTFIEECRRQKISVLPPDVNQSLKDFCIEEGTVGKASAIRFGLLAIKGVGEGIVDGIVAERAENGRFIHLYEFCERLKPFGINRTAVDALIKAGALDSIDTNRRRLLNAVDGALSYADSQNRSRLAGQDSLFGESTENTTSHYPVLPETDLPGRAENLAMEKEVMGIYVSDHPLRGLERTLASHGSHTCASALEQDDGVQVKLAGVVAKFTTRTSKRDGRKFASVVIEDFSGQMGAIAFATTYERVRETLTKDAVVQVTGTVTHGEMRGERSVELRIEDVKPLEAQLDLGPVGGGGGAGLVRVNVSKATEKQMRLFRHAVDEHPGDYELMIQILPEDNYPPIYPAQHVNPCESFLRAVKDCLKGANVEVVRHDPSGVAA